MLLDRERLFRLFVDSVRDYAIFMLDSDGHIVSWNPGAERLNGYTAEEATGRHFSMFYTDEARRIGHPDYELRHAREHGLYQEEGWRVRKDGSQIWAHVTITAVRDEDGTLLGFGKVTRDLTERKKAEEQLRQSAAEAQEARERVTNILESITDAFFALDRDWRFTYLNRRAEKLLGALGKSRDELLGGNLWDLVPEAVGTEFEREYHRAMESQATVEFDAFFEPLGIWFEVHAYPSAGGLSVYFRDVTARKEIERERQQLLERERFMAEASRALASSLDYSTTLARVARLAVPGVADYCLVDVVNEEGRLERVGVAHVDPSREQQLRDRPHPPAFASGSPALRVLESSESMLVAEVSDEWIDAVAQDEDHHDLINALQPRSALLVPLCGRETVLGVLWLVRSASAEPYATEDVPFGEELARRAATAIENSRLYSAVEAARGEAERRAREETALRHAAGAVSASFTVAEVIREIAQSAVAATNADGAFVEQIDVAADSVEVVAVAGENVPTAGSRLRYTGSLAESVVERKEPKILSRVEDAELPLSGDLASVCPGCSALVVPLVNAGEPIGALVLVRSRARWQFRPDEAQRALTFGDLAALAFRKVHILQESERRREELERVSESRARLMRGFSHDLKNPLGAADGFLQLIADGVMDDVSPRALEGVERARRAIGSAVRLIDDLLDLARAEAGLIELQRGPTDLREAARELGEEYRARAEAEDLELNMDLPDEFPVTTSDAARVRQILGNLLSNALKYTPSGGRIEVRARVAGDGDPGECVGIEVADSGPGIEPDELDLLFQEFTRLKTSGGKSGAGIGLAISQRIAQALGGRITVDSEVGKGSTFTLWLPLER